MVSYFGKSSTSLRFLDNEWVPTPVGESCAYCEEIIVDGDLGIMIPHIGEEPGPVKRPWHINCHLRGIIGSVAHINKRCSCYIPGATETDDENLTRRQAADAAVAAWKERIEKGEG